MNVVLIIIDTLRRDYLEPYGATSVRTPNFQRLAEMGATFDRAYLGSYPCMPARRDLWTGRYEFPWRGWGPLEPDDRDLISVLRDAGRPTMLVTDHYHLFERGSGNYHFAFDGWEFIRGQENDHWITDPDQHIAWPGEEYAKVHRSWAQYYRNTAQWRHGADGLAWQSEEHTFAAQTFSAAARWLDRNRSLDNFLLMIDCFDPHEPFDPPPPYDTMYAENPPEQRIRWPIYGQADRYTEEELADIRALYAGEVTLTDVWLGHFLDRLERLGRLEDTAILVTTDHGHLFGEHGMIGKPSAVHGDSQFYQPLAHIPLFLYHPDLAGGTRCPHLVQPVDIYPTVLDLMGVEQPEALHGVSLLSQMEGAPARETAAFAKFGEALNVTDGEWTLHLWPTQPDAPLQWHGVHPPLFLRPKEMGEFDGTGYSVTYHRGEAEPALYHVAEDYAQEHNLIEERPEVVARLRSAARDWLQSVGAPEELLTRFGLGVGDTTTDEHR